MTKRDFRRRIREAVSNPNLKVALDRAASAYATAREEAFEGLDFEELRKQLRAAKEQAILRLPELFEQFRREAERVGVQVHQAADAEEANRIVAEIARSRGVRKIAKAKSMLSEEIGLNAYLTAAGLDVVETDLGEWICQLAGEAPSHFTAPALHKTREEIAELLSAVAGEKLEADIPSLVETARRQMRQAFLDADMGISGANIAIADTGTLVIVSNEGNARLVTSLPEVHVALVGYEKLMPSMDEAAAVLKLLSKSGTGQKMTSYVSFITGPSRTSDIEKTVTLGCHGPREVHTVLVDNGRLALLDDVDFREALYCIKCGACLTTCPVYRSVGGHVFGHTYMGGIGAILAAFHAGLGEAEDIVSICSACRRCVSYCPASIDIPRMIVGLRHKILEARGQPWLERLVFSKLLRKPERLDAAMTLGRAVQKAFLPRGKAIDRLPFPLSRLSSFRRLPLLAELPLRQRLPEVVEAKGARRGTVALYAGCLIEYVYPEIGEAVAKVLARLGYEVHVPVGQGCCGIPALVKGDQATARELARYNLTVEAFESADHVVAACPTCALAIRDEFVRLVGDSAESEVAELLAGKVRDFSQFLISDVQNADELEGTGSGGKVTYHDPCHAKHGLGISREPRQVLQLAGWDVVEMEEADGCCGFAGSYCISYPEISESILERKVQKILATGAGLVASDCPGCLLQLRGALEKAGSDVRVAHVAEMIGLHGGE